MKEMSLLVVIFLKEIGKSCEVSYLAAQPPQFNQSFTGSAIPYPDAEIAYENTKNKGKK